MNATRLKALVVWGERTVRLTGFGNGEVGQEACDYILTVLRGGIENGSVNVVSCIERSLVTVQFDFLGFRYEMGAERDSQRPASIFPVSIEKIAKVDAPCEFSDFYGDHDTIVIEDYRLKRQIAETPAWGSW